MAADGLRVVLDTQIIVRGLVRRRTSAAVELFDLALEHRRILGVTSPILLDECARVLKTAEIRALASPPLDDDLIERAVRYIGERFTVVPGAFQDVDRVPKDAKDNPLVEAALEGSAQAIVSDDVHLLSLKVRAGCDRRNRWGGGLRSTDEPGSKKACTTFCRTEGPFTLEPPCEYHYR